MNHKKLYALMSRHVRRHLSGNARDLTELELRQLKTVVDSHYFLKLKEREDERAVAS